MIRSALKQIYYSVASATGAASRRMKRLRTQREVAILNLHRVSPEPSDYWPPLAPEVFEELLRYLSEEFHVCDVRELSTAESNNKPIAVLSFDDGYYDFIEHALPIIDRYRLPVNMNVIPQCAITGKPIWNVRLYDFLHAASAEEINGLNIPGFRERLDRDDPQSKVRYGIAVSRYLKNRPRREREEILESIEPRIEEKTPKGTRMMSSDELRRIADRVSFGAHSYSHESMGFEDESFFEDDFQRCRRYFENELSQPLSIYAFPNGSYRPEQIEYLRRNEVKQVLLVDEKFADAGSDVLTRLTIYGDSGAEVRMKALGL